jgi:hypothetical protein
MMTGVRSSSPGRSLWLAVCAVVLLVPAGSAQGNKQPRPTWPKVNVALAYQVDPCWPQRPADVTWDHVPGIAVDAHDHVYVFTRGEPPVQVYDAQGRFLRSWGKGVIQKAHHIKIGPDGNVWISDVGRHVVEKYTPQGKCLLTLGTVDHPGMDEKHFYLPTDMALSPTGDVFVSDGYGNARIVHFDRNGKFVKAWGRLGSKPGEFSLPHAMAIDSQGRLYVADRNNVRVQVFSQQGKLLDVWDNLIVPWGFAVTKTDEIWVCGSSPMQWRKEDGALGCPPKDQVLMKFSPDGRLRQLWIVPKGIDGLEQPGQCNWVHAIALDSQGSIYVGDITGKRAQKFVKVKP